MKEHVRERLNLLPNLLVCICWRFCKQHILYTFNF